MSIILRDYQKEIETQIYKKWNEKSNRLDGNKKSILVQSPTGSGKTRIFSDIANKAEKKGSTVLILTHREELLSQTGGSLVEIGLFPSLVTRDVKHPPKGKLVVGMIETVIRRLKQPEWIEWYKSVNLVINDECFTADTELLTENGFIKFDRLDKSKKVAQFDNGNISFVNPTRYVQKDHTGEMSIFHVKHGIDVPMTCGHEQLLYSRKNGYYKNKISEIKFNYTKLLPVSGLSNIECDELTDLERLYIATQADGSMHYEAISHTIIAFSFSKKRKIDRFLSLCKSCDIEVVKVECNHGERYMARMPIGTTKDIRNHIPYPMSATKAKQVIEECALWDGHTPNKTMLYYSSTDKTQADFYNSVAVLAGFCCFMSIQKDYRQERYKDTYRLYMRRDIINKATQLMSVKKDSYDGMVYCVEVPSGAIVVRHNGFTFVSGNCHEQLFNRIFEIPLTKEKFVLGFTATPERSGHQRQLSQDYEDMVIGLDVQQLINLGYLVPDKYYSIPVDMKGVSVSKGEFDSSEMFNRYNKSELYSGVIDNWKRLCPNTITLVFCCNIQHSINTCKALNDAGIKSKFIVSDVAKPQPLDEKATKGDIAKYNIKVLEYENYLVSFESFSGKRKDVIQQWKDGEFYVLINAGIATTGFDHPPTETVIMNRATMSSNLLQQCLDSKTEVLTNNGWKTHSNINYSDLICGYDINTGYSKYVPILDITNRILHADEKMYGIKNNYVDIRVTGGHRMIISNRVGAREKRRYSEYRFCNAEEIKTEINEAFIVPVSAKNNTQDCGLSEWDLKLVGLILSDGYILKDGAKLSQSVDNKTVPEIDRILINSGVHYTKSFSKRTSKCYDNASDLYNYYINKENRILPNKGKKGLLGIWHLLDKTIPESFDLLSSNDLKNIFHGYYIGNGNKGDKIDYTRHSFTICVSNMCIANRFQQLMVTNGIKCMVSPNGESPSKLLHYSYEKPYKSIRVKATDTRQLWDSLPSEINETVWCVTNELSTLITRRNGKVSIVGNCIGRGSRIFKNKTHFNLLDFGDNCSRLGYYRQQREWSLTHEESKSTGQGVGAVKDCPSCGALIHASSRICKYCGYVFPITHEQKIVDLVEISYSEAVKKLESIKDYEIYSEAKGYSKAWLFRQVFIKYGKDGLIEYAKTHNFPQNWVYIQIARYNAQNIRK